MLVHQQVTYCHVCTWLNNLTTINMDSSKYGQKDLSKNNNRYEGNIWVVKICTLKHRLFGGKK